MFFLIHPMGPCLPVCLYVSLNFDNFQRRSSKGGSFQQTMVIIQMACFFTNESTQHSIVWLWNVNNMVFFKFWLVYPNNKPQQNMWIICSKNIPLHCWTWWSMVLGRITGGLLYTFDTKIQFVMWDPGFLKLVCNQVSTETNPGWLGYIGDYTTQLYRDHNKPLQGSLLTIQCNGK